jgi:DNA-binding response OmpR family regulator
MKKILIIEDDESILIGLEDNLRHEGYAVTTATDGKSGLRAAVETEPDVILLDLMLPGMDGYSVCRELRKKEVDIPVIMLTAKTKETEKVKGLNIGADDYVTKPFSIKELMARIDAVLRRYERTKSSKKQRLSAYDFDDIRLDFKKYEAYKSDKKIKLTNLEFNILEYLIRHKGEVIARDELLNEIWGYEVFPATRTVDNFIVRIRKTVEKDPKNPKRIVSVRGAGYKFIP